MMRLRKILLITCFAGMLFGLLCSRAILSSSMILFIAASVFHKNFSEQFKCYISSPYYWCFSILFIIPLLSGLWSNDTANWLAIMQIKLPLLFMPLAFAGLTDFTKQDWKFIALIFLACISAGISWSVFHYLQNIQVVHKAYLSSGTILTPLENDHVRFSLLVTVSILTAGYLLKNDKTISLVMKWLLGFVMLASILFLHLLAVRTGLISFYMAAIILIAYLLIKKTSRLKGALLLMIIVAMPVAAYFIFPTFKNRVSYLLYDYSFLKKDIYLPGSDDGVRRLTIYAGWRILQNHPVAGTGFGDIQNETFDWYQANYPEMEKTDWKLPSSQFIFYGAGSGWPGIILFTMSIILPFFLPVHKTKIEWRLLNFIFALSYLFDIGLEVQYGVFVHCFILLWWYKWMESEN